MEKNDRKKEPLIKIEVSDFRDKLKLPENLSKFLSFFVPIGEQITGLASDIIKQKRLMNLLNTLEQVEEKAKRMGGVEIDAHEIFEKQTTRFVSGYIEKSSLESDSTLQAKWATLLLNCQYKYDAEIEFIESLSKLDPDSAKLLDNIFHITESVRMEYVETKRRNEKIPDPSVKWSPFTFHFDRVFDEAIEYTKDKNKRNNKSGSWEKTIEILKTNLMDRGIFVYLISSHRFVGDFSRPTEEESILLKRLRKLDRLNLVEFSTRSETIDHLVIYMIIAGLTEFGFDFVNACSEIH
jgi:hypothetical protein